MSTSPAPASILCLLNGSRSYLSSGRAPAMAPLQHYWRLCSAPRCMAMVSMLRSIHGERAQPVIVSDGQQKFKALFRGLETLGAKRKIRLGVRKSGSLTVDISVAPYIARSVAPHTLLCDGSALSVWSLGPTPRSARHAHRLWSAQVSTAGVRAAAWTSAQARRLFLSPAPIRYIGICLAWGQICRRGHDASRPRP